MKLPEPQINVFDEEHRTSVWGYTESQMRQAIKDAYEEAAKVCENMERNGAWITKLEAATHIRNLKEEVE